MTKTRKTGKNISYEKLGEIALCHAEINMREKAEWRQEHLAIEPCFE